MQAFELPQKHPVLGVGISATTCADLCGACRRWIEDRRMWKDAGSRPEAAPAGRCICVCNVHSVMTGVLQPGFKAILNSADVATPDGMPLAWFLRSFGVKNQPRVYGPDLMLALCAQAAHLGNRVFLYGGREEMLLSLSGRLRERFPGLAIAGACAPPFRPLTAEEDAACMKMITEVDADVVFVGIGVPRQECWMAEHRHKLPGVVMVGVGAAFDFHAGRIRQAPRWMRQAGLEWFFRLMMEPRRLWKRYLLLNPLFLAMWAMQKARILRYGTVPEQLTD